MTETIFQPENSENSDQKSEVSYIFSDYKIYASPSENDPTPFWGNIVFEFHGKNLIDAYHATIKKIVEETGCDPKRIRFRQFYRI